MAQRLLLELQVHAVHGKELLILLAQGVLGLGEDGDKGVLVQLVEGDHHGSLPTNSGMSPYLSRSSG